MEVLDLMDFLDSYSGYFACNQLVKELMDCVIAQDADKISQKQEQLSEAIKQMELDVILLVSSKLLKPLYRNDFEGLQADMAKMNFFIDKESIQGVDKIFILNVLWGSILHYRFNNNSLEFLEKIRSYIEV